jgi:hypothetical protein
MRVRFISDPAGHARSHAFPSQASQLIDCAHLNRMQALEGALR